MKAPDLIIISGTGDNVAVSFGRTRQRKLQYKQTVSEYGHIELERDSETPDLYKPFSAHKIYNEIKKSSGAPDDVKKPVKEPLANNKQIVNLDKIRKITDVNCSHTCKYFGFIHPCMVCWDDTKKYLCIKDWIKAGNRKITNPNQVIEINPNGDLLKIHT